MFRAETVLRADRKTAPQGVRSGFVSKLGTCLVVLSLAILAESTGAEPNSVGHTITPSREWSSKPIHRPIPRVSPPAAWQPTPLASTVNTQPAHAVPVIVPASHREDSRPDGWSRHARTAFEQPREIRRTSLELPEVDTTLPFTELPGSVSNLASPAQTQVRLPLAGLPTGQEQLELASREGRLSLTVRDSQVDVVLGAIAQQFGLNVVTAGAVSGKISVTLTDVALEDALDAILKTNGYIWVRDKNIILVSPMGGQSPVAPGVQGREVRVFPLNFVLATDMQTVIQGLLSPVGKSFVTESNSANRRKTHEAIVVEDLPPYLERIAMYLAEADRPPRQVLIEAHILEVSLQDTTEHGVDFAALARVAGSTVIFSTPVFNTPASALDSITSPSYSVNVVGNDLLALIEAIKRTTDAKTLASPKSVVINGQESRIQVGQRLGYFVTTTTQTSTLQEVQFLETGIVLRVTPTITEDNRVLMTVKPQISDGTISDLGLPQERTTEVETTVMLQDGCGIVIGGLIKEDDIEQQTKIPILGDIWLAGRMFQRRKVERTRREIVIGLVPRIVPYEPGYQSREDTEFERATTPLLTGGLKRVDRTPYEPQLPDAIADPRRPRWNRFPEFFKWKAPFPKPAEYYFPTYSDENPPPAGYLSEGARAAGLRNGTYVEGSYSDSFAIPPSPQAEPIPVNPSQPPGLPVNPPAPPAPGLN